jgi:hypothetical protein
MPHSPRPAGILPNPSAPLTLPSENEVSVIIYAASLRVAELEQKIALLQSQVDSLRAENVEKFKVIQNQKRVMQDQEKVTEELENFRDGSGEISQRHFVKDKLLLDQASKIRELTEERQKAIDIQDQKKVFQELEKLREEAVKMLERIAMKDKLILDQESQIQKLMEERRENEGIEVVTNKLFEVEEENKKLRNEKSQTPLVLSNWAVSRLLATPLLGSNNPVTIECLEMIRSDPTLLLENDKVHLLSAGCIKMVLMHPKKQRYALTLFRVLQKWHLGSRQSGWWVTQDLVQHIALECIDSLQLSTTVRSSGFVSDSMLCDAYAKQAANKDAAATKKAANKDEGKKR